MNRCPHCGEPLTVSGGIVPPSDEWKFTPAERRVFIALQKRGWPSSEALAEETQISVSSVKVVVTRMREKLRDWRIFYAGQARGPGMRGYAQLEIPAVVERAA